MQPDEVTGEWGAAEHEKGRVRGRNGDVSIVGIPNVQGSLEPSQFDI